MDNQPAIWILSDETEEAQVRAEEPLLRSSRFRLARSLPPPRVILLSRSAWQGSAAIQHPMRHPTAITATDGTRQVGHADLKPANEGGLAWPPWL
jgi:hypothetical protein